MRSWRVLLFLCLALPGLAAAAERVTVQLNWKHQFEFAAFYAALEMGYYRDAGLDVTVLEGGPGVDVVQEVTEGRADFGVGTSALVVEHHEGKPVVALASMMQHSPIALLALRRSGVNSVHDLAGKPVAVDPHSRDEIDAYMRAAGIPADQIRFVDQTDWTLQSLEEGRDVAKVVYVSNEPYFIQGREHEFVLLRPQSAGIDLFGNMLFTTRDLVERRRETARNFRSATLAGLAYALRNPQPMVELILQRYNTQGKSREHLLFEAAQVARLTAADIVEPGYMSPGRWQHVASVYAGQMKVPADLDLAGFVYDEQPASAPTWLRPVLFAALIALLATTAFVIKFRRLNAELERRVASRTAELVAARDEAQRLAQSRSEFLANMSHEIRTPLNAVLGFARIGERDCGQSDARQSFVHIRRASRHLLGVVDDILDFTRLDAGKLSVHPQPVRLAEILEGAESLVAETARDKGLALTLDTDPDLPTWVYGDGQRLQQILVNLLANAVKFTDQGAVQLKVSAAGELVSFAVSDTGIGLTDELLARLFKPFEQADTSSRRRFGGSGLGLAISQRLAALMGGRIQAEQLPAGGSRFTLQVPLPAAAAPLVPADATPAAGTAPLAGIRVLAVEDVELNRLVLQDLLESGGAAVSFAFDGAHALRVFDAAGDAAFDLVLMDIQMPDMDGYEVTRRLHQRSPGLPVVGVTAHALPEDLQRCLDAGMVERLTKPIDAAALTAAVTRWARPQQQGARADQPVPRLALPARAADTTDAGLDPARLLAQCCGRQDLVDRLLNVARQTLAGTPDALRAAVAARDLQRLAFVSHDLKGAAAALTVEGLGRLAARAEAAARTGSPEAITLGLTLADGVARLQGELDALLRPGVVDG